MDEGLGGSALDLSALPTQRRPGGLSIPQWIQLGGTMLQHLGIGQRGNRLYPFGPLAQFGGALQGVFEQSRAKAFGEAIAQRLPASSPLRPMIGPLMASGDLSMGQVLQLVQGAQQHDRSMRVADAITGLPNAAPMVGVEVAPREPGQVLDQLLPGEDPEAAAQLPRTLGAPPSVEAFPGQVTRGQLMQSIQGLPDDIRPDVLQMMLPELRKAPESPVDLKNVQKFRSLVQTYQAQNIPRTEAIAAARRVVFDGETPQQVETSLASMREQGPLADALLQEAANLRTISPREAQRLETMARGVRGGSKILTEAAKAHLARTAEGPTPKTLTDWRALAADPQQLPDVRTRAATIANEIEKGEVKIAGAKAAAREAPPGTELPGTAMTVDRVPPAYRKIVEQLVNYRIPLPSGFALRSPFWQRALSYAGSVDPSFDATQYNVRLRTRQDFTSGKSATNIRALNTAIGHLETLKKKSTALSNSSVVLWNEIANRGITAVGDPRVVEFNNAANAVESEAANVFKGMGATDQEIKAWRANLNASMSPDQLTKSIDTITELLGSRMEALHAQYEAGTGKQADFNFLTDRSRMILKGLGDEPDRWDPKASSSAPTTGPGQTFTLPDGTTVTVR